MLDTQQLQDALCGLSDVAVLAANSLQQASIILGEYYIQLLKEIKSMELKLILYKARATELANRGTHNAAIVAHLLRRIKNLEAKIGQNKEIMV